VADIWLENKIGWRVAHISPDRQNRVPHLSPLRRGLDYPNLFRNHTNLMGRASALPSPASQTPSALPQAQAKAQPQRL